MTIAAGFLCDDGAVLAADSQHTGPTKRYSAKVWYFNKPPNTVGIAGAGDSLLIRKFRDEVKERLLPTMTPKEVRQMLDDVLYPQWVRYVKPDDEAMISLLVVTRTVDGLAFYENQGGGAFATVDKRSQVIGSNGSILGKYLADWLFDVDCSVRYARTVAAHVVRQAKEHDPDAGGQTRIVMIPADYGSDPSELDPQIVTELETQLDYVKGATREIIIRAGIPGLDMNSETADRRRQTLDTAVSSVKAHYMTCEPGHISLSGTLSLVKITGPETPADDLSGVVQPPPNPEG